MRKSDLRIYAKGSAFEDGLYDLRSVELLISNYRSITDRLIAVQLGRRQLTPSIRKQIDYQARINQGSIELLIDFVFTHKEIVGSLAADGGYQLAGTITRLFGDAINLRKQVAELVEKGIPANIIITNNINIGSKNIIANSENGDVRINDAKILWAAQVTKFPADRLVSGIEGKGIAYAEFGSRDSAVRLTPDERVILGQNKEELTGEIRVNGRLDMVAFSSHRGTIVSGGEKFPVTWDDAIRKKMQKIVDTEGVIFVVRPIVDHKRLQGGVIAYHVIDCSIPQQNLNV
ncbi:hypothetical protein ACJO2E_10990 [Marinobacter sp. M1N3S26]|uniref:hypothetical protein n=1 Tax=Marinobacter sp. M1N3S26 TaxID=3382299 RepID=UPI00387B7E36